MPKDTQNEKPRRESRTGSRGSEFWNKVAANIGFTIIGIAFGWALLEAFSAMINRFIQ